MIHSLLARSFALLLPVSTLLAANPFPGEKTDHHGAALYYLQIGTERVSVLAPEKPGPGKPWVLAPSLYKLESPPVANMTRTELELVKRGFCVVALNPGNTFGAPQAIAKWDAVYDEMTQKHGLSKRVVMMGLSREGLSIARWAAAHPGRVSCLYMDKAVCDFKSWPGGKLGLGKGSPKDWQSLQEIYGFASEADALAFNKNPVDLAEKLAANKVAIVYVAGAKDDAVPVSENGDRMQAAYAKAGGAFKMIRRETEGHHPHGLEDPTPVADFIQYRHYGNPEPTAKAVAYGPHPKQILDFWKAPSEKPTPLAVYIHGGGWSGGSRVDAGRVQDFLNAGISVAAVEYRFIAEATADGVVPPVKGPLHDAGRALQFLRSNAAQWNLRKDRVAAWGGSAGGCTSLWLAFHKDLADLSSDDPVARESTRLHCVGAIVPQTTLDPLQMKEWTPNSRYGAHAFGIAGDAAAKKDGFAVFLEKRESLLPWIAEYSPYSLLTASAPPVYHTYNTPPNLGKEEKDPTHTANFGVKLQERLVELKVPATMVHPGAPNTRHPGVQDFLIDQLNAP
jgi:hypothetical protein